MTDATRVPTIESLAHYLRRLGDIAPERVRWNPPPGTATEADLVRVVDVDKRMCELVEGSLVERASTFRTAQFALHLACHLITFIQPRRLGLVAGAGADGAGLDRRDRAGDSDGHRRLGGATGAGCAPVRPG